MKSYIAHGKLFSFLRAGLEVQDVLHSERGDMLDNYSTLSVLSVNLQLFSDHEDYNGLVKTPRGITVA